MRWPGSLTLTGIDPAEVEPLLEECRLDIEAFVTKGLGLPLRALDSDDIRSLGRVAVLESMATFLPTRGCNPRSWAQQMIYWRISEAMQEAYEAYHTDSEFVEEVCVSPKPSPEESAEHRSRRERLRIRITRLPRRQRRIVMRQLQGRTTREIATELNVSQPAVVKQLQHAVATLRETL